MKTFSSPLNYNREAFFLRYFKIEQHLFGQSDSVIKRFCKVVVRTQNNNIFTFFNEKIIDSHLLARIELQVKF